VKSRCLPLTSSLVIGCCVLWDAGCVHTIHVTPAPPVLTERSIDGSVQVTVPFIALEGADHMPGIGSFDWPAKDLQNAAIDYIRARRTFSSVGAEPATFTLTMNAWLTLRSRGLYHYRLRVESDLGPAGKPAIKSYVVEKETVGSSVRWITASDRDPIQEAVQAVLDDLLLQIEADAHLYRTTAGALR
jgi:hypothetical protein